MKNKLLEIPKVYSFYDGDLDVAQGRQNRLRREFNLLKIKHE